MHLKHDQINLTTPQLSAAFELILHRKEISVNPIQSTASLWRSTKNWNMFWPLTEAATATTTTMMLGDLRLHCILCLACAYLWDTFTYGRAVLYGHKWAAKHDSVNLVPNLNSLCSERSQTPHPHTYTHIRKYYYIPSSAYGRLVTHVKCA